MTTHGHTRKDGNSPTYRSWTNMRTRCENPKATQFAYYGGRGIKVCERWQLFDNFLADMGVRPSLLHTLDRFPNHNGNYEPGNCRWATRTEQGRNRRSNRAVLRGDGIQFASMTEAAESVGGDLGCIWDVCNGKLRQHRGFSWSYA